MGRYAAAAVYSKLDTLQITAMDASKISHNQANFQSYGLYTSGNLVITEESTGMLIERTLDECKRERKRKDK